MIPDAGMRRQVWDRTSRDRRATTIAIQCTCVLGFLGGPGWPQALQAQVLEVDVPATLQRLLAEEDADGDARITIDDLKAPGMADARFHLRDVHGQDVLLDGTYALSNLLQELTLASPHGTPNAGIDLQRVFENPVDRISRHIREIYWDNLTRRIDVEHLAEVTADTKTVEREAILCLCSQLRPFCLQVFLRKGTNVHRRDAAAGPDHAKIRAGSRGPARHLDARPPKGR